MPCLLRRALCLVFWDINSNLHNTRQGKLREDSHTSSTCFPREPAIIMLSRFAGARPHEQQCENNSMRTRHEKYYHRGSGKHCVNSFREKLQSCNSRLLALLMLRQYGCQGAVQQGCVWIFVNTFKRSCDAPKKHRSHLFLLSLPHLESNNTGKDGHFLKEVMSDLYDNVLQS